MVFCANCRYRTGMTPPRILIVEDEAIVARDVRMQLEALGYASAGVASSGQEAVALAAALCPDLVLMDIALGNGLDGIAAALAIRAQQSMPVVFLTAFAADEMLARASLAEPYGYILKPFLERELRTVLQMALYKHAADARAHDLAAHNQAILDNMLHGTITIDVQGVIASCNRGVCSMFGYEADQLLGHNVSLLMPEAQRVPHNAHLQRGQRRAAQSQVCQQREVQGLRKNGSVFPLSLSVSRLEHQGQTAFVAVLDDLSRHRQDAETIHQLAYYDDLTGLPNRRRLLDRLKQAIAACQVSGQHGALIFLDLDHFRQLNETLGPGFGDDLLREVARRLPACVRDDDTVAHLGGDEFMVMLDALGLNNNTAATHAEGVANKILQALRQPYSLRGRPHTSSASVGIVMFNKACTDFEELLKMADAAMYQAKDAGRNTVRFFDPAMQALVVARTELEKDIQRALTHDEFVLHYQLQVDARGVPLGVEALVRWLHPVRGLVAPGQFIAVAEATGLILPLGQWVLEDACRQLVLWSHQSETAHWTMAVNVSALQFAQDGFVAGVAQAIELAGAKPHLLKLELTESMLVHDVGDVIAKMHSIKALGVSFSLDDFGTGYSSLSHLKRLPIDQLKIDQSFVRDLLTDPDDAVISQAIVALGHNLGLKVIAEGVESAGQRDYLASLGCDAFQGYFFGHPVPHAVLTQRYIEHRPLAHIE